MSQPNFSPRTGLLQRHLHFLPRHLPSPWRPALTLVELLAVVIILGLLAATLTLSFRGQVSTAKRQLAKTGISVVVSAVETFAIETGRVPTMEEGLYILTLSNPSAHRTEPYLKPDKLLDPWRTPYMYIAPGPKGAYVVISYGADQQPGGATGTDASDITSDDLGNSDGSAVPTPSGDPGGGSGGASGRSPGG